MVHMLLLALMRYAPHQKVTNNQSQHPTHQTIHINATKKKKLIDGDGMGQIYCTSQFLHQLAF